MGVRPALPIEGIHFILGNGLAGKRVWADIPPSPVVTPCPVVEVSGVSRGVVPDALPACVVTCAMSRIEPELPDGKPDGIDFEVPSLSDFTLIVQNSELVREQSVDLSIKEIFDRVLPTAEVHSAASGYFLQNGLLFRKGMAIGGDCVGDAVVQLVVPAKFRPLVLEAAHDESGHFGVKKTYLNIVKHFFWPRVKRDVAKYIKTCHVCQLAGKPNQCIKAVPLQPVPAVSEPFECLIVDCVGPLSPAKSGCKYLLTVMCQSTRYPAA